MTQKQLLLQEAAAWRALARRIDRGAAEHMYADLCRFPVTGLAFDRLGQYDNPAWCYGPEDDYDSAGPADKVLACLWLALDAEDDAGRSR